MSVVAVVAVVVGSCAGQCPFSPFVAMIMIHAHAAFDFRFQSDKITQKSIIAKIGICICGGRTA